MEVTNRFKGLDLVDRVPEELWTEVRNTVWEVMNRFKVLDPVDRMPNELWTGLHNTEQEVVTKTIPKQKKCKKAFEEVVLKRPYK